MDGMGILKGLGVTMKRFVDTYLGRYPLVRKTLLFSRRD